MVNNDSSYKAHFFDALSSALEVLGPSKELILRHLEVNYAISIHSDKLPSIEQVEKALKDVIGSGADAIIHSLKENRKSYGTKAIWPSIAPMVAYASCMFGCAGVVCCGMLHICKLVMMDSM